jgi:hypothetical protein
LWSGDFRLDVGVMSHVVLPIFFPETINLPHFLLSIVYLLIFKFFPYFLLEPIRLYEALRLSYLLAIPQVLIVLLLHYISIKSIPQHLN